jgi:glycosyltransferase involved in cell wall biosynthesis
MAGQKLRLPVRTIHHRRQEIVKRLVLLAPAAVPPLTEGRKKFVIDLTAALRAAAVDVVLLDGMPAASPATMMLHALRQLRGRLAGGASIDAVAVFPFGAFRGVRGQINAWFLRQAKRLCASAQVPQMPVIYSCAGLDIEQLGARFGPALAVGRAGRGIERMHLGIRHSTGVWQPGGSGLQRLLFLCGYQKATASQLRDVLHERGLADLLAAGNDLAAAGMRLTIAIPFLRDARLHKQLRSLATRQCPALEIDMVDEIDPAVAFTTHDAFVFPYRTEHSVFIPTSLLEAMSCGIPVIAADHAMYRDLTIGADGPRCQLHRIGDARHLAQTARAMQLDYGAAIDKARVASAQVRAQWTLDRAAGELLTALTLQQE